MKIWHFPVMALGLIALTGASEQEPSLPAWMAGCWEQLSGDDWTEECWTPPRGGIMLGSGRSGTGNRLGEWEAMQIILDQPAEDGPVVRMVFWGSPRGANRTLFAWSPDGGPGVTFHSVVHDYPQRIHYRPEGPYLIAEVSMEDGSKLRRWSYKRK